jgi:hypothetical protein
MGVSKEIWLPILKGDYDQANTWLDKAQSWDAFIENDVLHTAEDGGSELETYKNKTDDVDSIEPTETPNSISLDYYDTQNYKIRHGKLETLPYDKIKYYTDKGAKSLRKKEAIDAAYAFAPLEEGDKIFILPTTGVAKSDSFKRMSIPLLLDAARIADNQKWPEGNRHVVLTSDMWWDLAEDDTIKKQIELKAAIGKVDVTSIDAYGWTIHKHAHGVNFNLNAMKKAALGSATSIATGIVPAAFIFCTEETFRASGTFNMIELPFKQNTKGRATEFGFQHRFTAGKIRANYKYCGMIYYAPGEPA